MPTYKTKIPTESEEQIALVQWLEAQHPEVPFFHVPNGGNRSKATAGRLKAEGVRAGVPDIYLPMLSLWVEMKRTVGGRLSKEQAAWIEHLEDKCGHTVIVARGFEDAVRQIENHIASGGYDLLLDT